MPKKITKPQTLRQITGGRFATVEYEPGWGWVARDPWTGFDIMEPGFVWNSRYVARTVVDEARVLGPSPKWIAKQLAKTANITVTV